MNKLEDNSSNTEIEKHEFSYFKYPIRNIFPYSKIGLIDVYNVIKGDYFKNRTSKLQSITDKVNSRQYKVQSFDYVTFSGTFTKRNNNSLIQHSGLMVIDFDNLCDVNSIWKLLLEDNKLETQLLFISPSGNGLKWVIEIDLLVATHAQFFEGIKNYLFKLYKLEIDNSGKDVARACFIPHDSNIYINPKHLHNEF